MSALPPFTHFGRYRIVRELGRGAMGVVYEAQDESLDRPVALKTMRLPDDAAERSEHEARFRQEAKAAGGLNHPNVVTIHDLGREGEWLYIAMELLRGVEMRQLMAERRLTLPMAVDLLSQVAAGLAAAHARGIVHRDIKPSNVMVLAEQQAKIMDFGVARMQVSEVRTQAGTMLGSPKYMSPEQVAGRSVDHRSDIFSLGSVLYEAVAGVPAFEGSELANLLFNIVQAAPPPPSQRNPQVPAALDAVIGKAMRRDPAERYQDATELAHDLARCAAALAGAGVPPPRPVVAAPAPRAPADAQPAAASSGESHGATTTIPLARGSDEPTRLLPPQAGTAWPVSTRFDASAALQRLALRLQGQPTSRPGRYRWPLAYAVAGLAALWIALG